MVGLLVRLFNCTPLEAIRELRHNAYIWEVIVAEQYRMAFEALTRWEAIPLKDRMERGDEAPHGYWIRMVEKIRARVKREDSDARDAALRREGRA